MGSPRSGGQSFQLSRLRCTETGSHILAISIPVPLIRQGYNMASAMPDPNVNLQLQGSHCGFVAFLSCKRTASS